MERKYIFGILMILIIFGVNVVSANELVNDTVVLDDSSELLMSQEESRTDSADLLTADEGTFTDLENLINSSSGELTLDRNYVFDEIKDSSLNGAITINKTDLIINGNNYILDAKNKTGIFKILSNNVTINNVTFINGFSRYGGAVFWSGADGTLNNSNFYYNTAHSNLYGSGGGAIYWSGANGTLVNSNFENNSAKMGYSYSGIGGAVLWDGINGYLDNLRFIDNGGHDGGSIFIKGRYIKMFNSYFTSNKDYFFGAAVTVEGLNGSLENCSFLNYNSTQASCVVYWKALYGSIHNCTFINNTRTSLYVSLSSKDENSPHNFKITNCLFDHNTGRAIYLPASYGLVENCTFTNNYATPRGGAIYGQGRFILISNCTFINNSATLYGGAIYWDEFGGTHNSTVYNCTFINNTAYIGGAILWHSADGKIDKCKFYNNSADGAGAIYFAKPKYLNYLNATLKNSYFEGNFAKIRAATIYCYIPYTFLINNTFVNNYAPSTSLTITNVSDTHFTATFRAANNLGNVMYVRDNASYVFIDGIQAVNGVENSNGGTIPYADDREFNQTIVVEIFDSKGNLIFSDIKKTGLFGDVTVPLYVGTTIRFTHPEDKQYSFITSNTTVNRNIVVTASEQKVVAGKNVTIPVKVYFDDNTLIKEGFIKVQMGNEQVTVPINSSGITDVSIKSPLNGGWNSANITFIDLNGLSVSNNTGIFVLTPKLDIIKYSNEAIVNIWDNSSFTIEVTNVGNCDLENIVLKEDYSNALRYMSFKGNHWKYIGDNLFRYDEVLKIGETATITVIFNTTQNGTHENTACVKSQLTDFINASDNVSVLMYGLSIEKIALNPEIIVGNQAKFEIIVRNTGEISLNGIVITETSFDGLKFDGYVSSNEWDYDGKLSWTLKNTLMPNEIVSLFVTFNTTETGKYTNIATVNSKYESKQDNVTVNVVLPSFDVEKIALKPIVKINEQALFEIVLHNNGNIDLKGVYVIENEYEGLIFNHYIHDELWQHSIENGKHKWTLKQDLTAGEDVGLFVVFNTTKLGNYTNYAIVGSSQTMSTVVNATVTVNQTVVEEETSNPMLDIKVSPTHPYVAIGNQTIFEITVHNTGDAILNDVEIKQLAHEGLIFDSFIDYSGMWTLQTGNPTGSLLGASDSEYSWKLGSPFYVGEYLGFFVVFNTTSTGRFVNHVSGSSDKTPEKLFSGSVDVVEPEYTIEKIGLEKNVATGEQVMFEIVVHNIGKIDINDITIVENPDNGLIFDHYIDNMNMWINEGLTWRLNSTLLQNEYVGFFVVFNTTKEGNFTNSISSGNKTANASVNVIDSHYVIEKIALNKTVSVGDDVTFEIRVHNTGLVNIKNIVIFENPDNSLTYLDYSNIIGIWIKEGYSWKLNSTLNPKAYSSFYITFKTTKPGNITNEIVSGNLTSNVTVEVKNKTLDQQQNSSKNETNKTLNKIPKKTENKHKHNTDDGLSSLKNHRHQTKIDSNKTTGNPIFVLVIILLNLAIFRRCR